MGNHIKRSLQSGQIKSQTGARGVHVSDPDKILRGTLLLLPMALAFILAHAIRRPSNPADGLRVTE